MAFMFWTSPRKQDKSKAAVLVKQHWKKCSMKGILRCQLVEPVFLYFV